MTKPTKPSKERVKEEFDTKFKFVGFFHSTLKEIYGKTIADEIMKIVNKKMRQAKLTGMKL